MPANKIFRLSFIDGTTEDVNAPDAAAAKAHVDELIAAAKHVGGPYKGKALAGTAPVEVNKMAEREKLNAAARG